jgi:hypothetical protein
MLYEALEGGPPFGLHASVNASAKRRRLPAPPPQPRPQCPDLVELCRQLLMTDPRRRPHADAVASCFERSPANDTQAGRGAPAFDRWAHAR